MNSRLDLSFVVKYRHQIFFTENAFDKQNTILKELVGGEKVLSIIDAGLATSCPEIITQWSNYVKENKIKLTRPPIILMGGEESKQNQTIVNAILAAIEEDAICRHSYVIVMGGGALLDAVGFATSIAHRGVRLIRMPSTTLSQADAGVGVKNGINLFQKKNFTGTFTPPYAVVNDFTFLKSLSPRNLRDGLVEAVKVALLKDAEFFNLIEKGSMALRAGDMDLINQCVRRSAELHALHITQGGDPFELGSARPLDLGHWVAHKCETLSKHRLSHGEAVAIGLAVDVLCARELGLFSQKDSARVINLLVNLGFSLYAPELDLDEGNLLMQGLEEFREHLGGKLTLIFPTAIGQSTVVHQLSREVVRKVVTELHQRTSCAALS
jgi:3-dehydroquinate synthase